MDIDEIIEFECEHTGLDFKATQYRKETSHELLKDVIAMANAFIDGDRLIITGVKKQSGGSFTINPIPQNEFQDSATYQQLILDNIEPDLHIDYQPHLYKGIHLVGVFTIPAGNNKPYMMKKLYSGGEKATRKPGESFMRKGTTTAPLMRKDIDRIIDQRIKAETFTHTITCYFSNNNRDKVIRLAPNVPPSLYSQRQADKIKSILAKREKEREEEKERAERAKQNKLLPTFNPFTKTYLDIPRPFFETTSYEQRSDETLLKNLASIKETYEDEDLYEVFEEHAAKVNFVILNEGTKYLEDATIEIRIHQVNGLMIADELYKKPVYRNPIEALNMPPVGIDYEALHYPHYQKENGAYVFVERVGDLRHLQPKEVFEVPMRIAIGNALLGQEIEVGIVIHGKNLPVPIKDKLVIKVGN